MQKSRWDGNTRNRVVETLVVACLVIVSACQPTTGLPRRAVEFTPPAAYQRWWNQTQKCSGKAANFAALRWYRVPGSQFKSDGHDVRGYYDPADNSIVLSDSLAAFAAGVRHEILHALDGVPGHPRDLFQEDCARLVTCPATCEEDGGAWRAPEEWVPTKVGALRVSASAELLPEDIDGERWLVIHAMVTNPLSHPIVAIMPPTYSFEFTLVPKSGGEGARDAIFATDSSVYFFGANETKEFLFELVVGDKLSRYSVSPGDYVYSTGFGCHWTKAAPVTVLRAEASPGSAPAAAP